MSKARIIFMGTPEFAVPCLKKLIEDQYNIIAVVTQPDRPQGRGKKIIFSPVKEFALQYNLPVLQPPKIKTTEFVAQLRDLKPDAIIVVAFGQLLSQDILDIPPLGCINVHASLLPKYRGSAPLHWSIINGETTTGVTTMFMDSGMDTGDMILASETAIRLDETTGQLHDRLKDMGAALLQTTMELVIKQQAPRHKQNPAEATYAPMLSRNTERIDWTKPAAAIHNLVRGLAPWPGSYCCHNNKTLKVWRTRVLDVTPLENVLPGRIRTYSSDGIIVETGDGLLEILEVQPECKRRMSTLECACGYCLDIGEILA